LESGVALKKRKNNRKPVPLRVKIHIGPDGGERFDLLVGVLFITWRSCKNRAGKQRTLTEIDQA